MEVFVAAVFKDWFALITSKEFICLGVPMIFILAYLKTVSKRFKEPTQ